MHLNPNLVLSVADYVGVFGLLGLPIHVDLAEIIKAVGYIGLFIIIFSESGLLIGLFLPGDSLLFTAGFLASEGFFNIGVLIVICVAAAISGDTFGYWFGRRVGRRLYDRPDSRWFKRKHLVAAEVFYAKHGGKTIVLARFMPIVRTLAPIVAGSANMPYRRFVAFNVIGGLLWGAGLPAAGYLLGEIIPDVDKYLLPLIAGIVILSLLPSFWHVYRENRHEIIAMIRRRTKPVESAGVTRSLDD